MWPDSLRLRGKIFLINKRIDYRVRHLFRLVVVFCWLLLLLFFYEEGAESFMYIHCRTGCVTVLSLNLVDIFTLK